METVNSIFRKIRTWTTVAGFATFLCGIFQIYTFLETTRVKYAIPEPVPVPVVPMTYSKKIEEKIDALILNINNWPEAVLGIIYRAFALQNYLLNLVVGGIISLTVVYFISKIVIRKLCKLYRSAHGCVDFRGEAMMPGSKFTPSEVPQYQASIFAPGILTKTFLGYGIRYKNILCVPEHVIKGLSAIGIGGAQGKTALVDAVPIPSRLVNDLVYIPLGDAVWATIGVTQFKYTNPPLIAAIVNCCGPKGYSTSTVQPSTNQFMLHYRGSTECGMSGAAYYNCGTVHGMHIGYTSSQNLGISIHVICKEINSMSWGESNEELNGTLPQGPVTNSWNIDAIDQTLKAHSKVSLADIEEQNSRNKVSWNDDEDFDDEEYLRKRGYTQHQESTTLPARRRVFRVSNVKVQGQGLEETTINLATTSVEEKEETPVRLGDIVRDLSRRIVLLENKVFPNMVECKDCGGHVNDIKVHVKNTHGVIKCNLCKSTFLSMRSLEQHVAMKHAKVTTDIEMDVLESAIPDDSKNRVTVSFLGSPKNSAPKKSKNSKNISKSPVARRSSPSQEENQKDILESLKNIALILSKLHKDTDGPSSEVVQK